MSRASHLSPINRTIRRAGRAAARQARKRVPKLNHAVIQTRPDLDDQGRAILPLLDRLGVERVYWLYRDEATAEVSSRLGMAGPRVRFVRSRTLRAALVHSSAKYVFFTHGLSGGGSSPRGQVTVNLWHGMPLKKLGLAAGRMAVKADITIATSDEFADLLAESWALDPDSVVVTGLPQERCDAPQLAGPRWGRFGPARCSSRPVDADIPTSSSWL